MSRSEICRQLVLNHQCELIFHKIFTKTNRLLVLKDELLHMGINYQLRKCVLFLGCWSKRVSVTLWKFCYIWRKKITVFHLVFFTRTVSNSFPYEGPHLVKSRNLALLGILVQLAQKLNQNVSVKHPILKKNLIKNPTKI